MSKLPAVVVALLVPLSEAARNFIAEMVIRGVSISLAWLREWVSRKVKRGKQ